MKNMKKLIALTCVAAMLVPTLAFAAETQTTPSAVTLEGDSVIENDNSVPYEYTSVVLPTTTNSTYNFQIDREGLLEQYDPANVYEEDATVFFHAEKTPAKIAAVAASTKLYEIGKVKDASATKLFAAITGKTLADAQAAAQGKFFVWTPVETDANGPGQWTEIVFEAYTPAGEGAEELPANYMNYIDVTLDESSKIASQALAAGPLSGEHIWDGNIYTIGYTEIDGAKAVVDYKVEVDEEGVITGLEDGLYTSANATDYTAVTDSTAATALKYTPATVQYLSTSDKATVENKSTTAIAFSVDVTIEAEGLTFSPDGNYKGADSTEDTEDDDAKASVYFTINDENGNAKVIDEKGKGTAYYVLEGSTNGCVTFQGSTPDEQTGSHNYYQYANPNATFESQSFTISATANALEASDAAWAKYIADVEEGKVVRPTIEVVYNWVEVDETETANTFEDEDGNTYTTDGTNGWVDTFESGEPVAFVPTTTFKASGDGTKLYFVPSPTGSVTSAKAYDAATYAKKGNRASVIADLEDLASVATSGSVSFTKTALASTLTVAGSYAIEVVVDGTTYTFAYTVK